MRDDGWRRQFAEVGAFLGLPPEAAPPEAAPPEAAPPEAAPPEAAPPEAAPPETVAPEAAPPETAPPETVRVTGTATGLPSRLPAADTAVACVAAALTSAARLQRQRRGRSLPGLRQAGEPGIQLDAAHIAAAVRSEAHLRLNGQSLGSGFAPLSRFWQTADGWIRTHANYPWHEAALLRALGIGAPGPTADDALAEAAASAIAERLSVQVEDDVVAAGGVAAAVRTDAEWRAHPQGRAVRGQPLIASRSFAGAPPCRHDAASLPAAGLRVLDLTRVIAGPVATRYLAALGADVLRLDPPHRPELPLSQYDGLAGKRSAVLDARLPGGLRRLHELLDGADVAVLGYRPGALAAFGLDSGSLAERHAGLVVVSVSAWGWAGPWRERRGFDSIVQAACGIAMAESPGGGKPGRLPCQLLDHATGYLAAAAALEGVRRQSAAGGTHFFDLSLAGTAAWLLRQPRPAGGREPPGGPGQAGEWLTTLYSDTGPVSVIAPPGKLGHRRLAWPKRLTSYGADEPKWRAVRIPVTAPSPVSPRGPGGGDRHAGPVPARDDG